MYYHIRVDRTDNEILTIDKIRRSVMELVTTDVISDLLNKLLVSTVAIYPLDSDDLSVFEFITIGNNDEVIAINDIRQAIKDGAIQEYL